MNGAHFKPKANSVELAQLLENFKTLSSPMQNMQKQK